LRIALDSPEPNPTAVGQLVLAQRALKTQLRASSVKLRGDISARLNPEQKQKFDNLRSRPWRHVPQP
jgi:Spy/CpxP family protein refolding chaperone